MNYQEKIDQHKEQMRKDGYSEYYCGDCDKMIWRRSFEDWFFCDDCTNKRQEDDKANGVICKDCGEVLEQCGNEKLCMTCEIPF